MKAKRLRNSGDIFLELLQAAITIASTFSSRILPFLVSMIEPFP